MSRSHRITYHCFDESSDGVVLHVDLGIDAPGHDVSAVACMAVAQMNTLVPRIVEQLDEMR